MQRLESTILKNLIYNEAYMRKVLPFLRSDYFKEQTERAIFTQISVFIDKYKNPPTYEALVINITETSSLKEEQIRDTIDLLKEIHKDRCEPTDIPWLTESTEKFCKDAALYNAILEAVAIMDEGGKDKSRKPKEAIPEILTQALGVSFDPNVGHDYLEQSAHRYEFYHLKEQKVPFDIEFLNKITNGGFSVKTLNMFLAGTGVGKTLVLCHLAANALSQGRNVLYITMEMSEERIAERIDANLLNVDISELKKLSKSEYDRKFGALRSKTNGKLIIKEYPTASASTLHFRSLLNELMLKKSFRPDIIFVDYLNICCSSRVRPGGNVNTYTYIKSIAEELRGLAIEYVVPIISATQTTRSGFDNSDIELTDTSESFGLPATADFFAAIITTEDLEKLNQFMFKQLKNRYQDATVNKRFVVGVDKPKMRLYDVSQSGQQGIRDAGDVQHQNVDIKMNKPFERDPNKKMKFSDFKY